MFRNGIIMSRKTVLIAAGGTGGHVMPALSLYDELIERGYRVLFVSDTRGHVFVPEALENLHVLPLTGRKNVLSLIKSLFWAVGFLRKERVQAVVSFGGYVAFPVNLAALISGCSYILHEQNALLGRVNRWFSCNTRALALTWKQTQALPQTKALKARIRVTGIPVRQIFQSVRKQEYRAPEDQESIHLLVLGGSQGASFFAQTIPKALASLPEKLHKRIRLVLQCPQRDLENARDACRRGNIKAELSVFFQDIEAQFKKAHFVIARSGASSVAEVAGAGRPALFVPYPFAMDDHQRANADAIVSEGGGWMCAQDQLTSDKLAVFLERVLNSPQALVFAAERARSCEQLNAQKKLADVVGEIVLRMEIEDMKESV